VIAVVPARDEAAVLPESLPTLLAQDYPGRFVVTLVDDASTDGTGQVAAGLGTGARHPLRVVAGQAKPPGWAGKPWAMAQGVAAIAADDAAYVLFTDADIAWSPGALRALVTAAEADDRVLVSQMVRLRTQTGWEKAIIPAFVYFFAQLYPFRWVNRPRGRTAAAAGGCMLVRRDALAAAGGIEPIGDALIDDVALGTLLKRQGRTWLGLTTAIRSVRPYHGLTDLWQMVARSAYTQLRYSPLLLAGTLIGLAWLYALPPATALAGLIALAAGATGTGPVLCATAGLAGWAVMTGTFLPMLRLYRLSPLRAPLLPGIAVLYAAMTADSARRHYAGRGGAWKGRVEIREKPEPREEARRGYTQRLKAGTKRTDPGNGACRTCPKRPAAGAATSRRRSGALSPRVLCYGPIRSNTRILVLRLMPFHVVATGVWSLLWALLLKPPTVTPEVIGAARDRRGPDSPPGSAPQAGRAGHRARGRRGGPLV
jgi:hopene-associated glycosyltransferase HpnB